MTDPALIAALAGRLGADAVRTDDEALALAASDLYVCGARPAAVVSPSGTDDVAATAMAAAAHGHAVVARGGGLSYTGGYAPPGSRTVTLDMTCINGILAIAEDDMTITVQAGTTWKQIDDALKPLGLRLPFIGTFSGAGATVGGGLSHGALFFGSARYGGATDNMLGMTVVLADGRVLRTGQAGLANARTPILRGFGPDLAGLFTHDGGMFGIKTEATFRLIRAPAEQGFASFAFADMAAAVDALCEIARADLAEDVYILDPQSVGAIDADAATAAKAAMSVARDAGGARKAIKALAALARGGTGFLSPDHFSLHMTAAGRTAAAVTADLAAAGRIAAGCGGRPVAATIPRVARAELFTNLNGVLGADGGRWAALNAKVAHSEARPLVAAFDAMIASHGDAMAEHRITCTRLASALGNHCFSFEAVFHWRDSWQPIHRAAADPAHLARFDEPPPNPGARAFVDHLRQEAVGLFCRLGAASNQIGRTYPFRSALSPVPNQLLAAIKHVVDPQGRMNPGVLGYP